MMNDDKVDPDASESTSPAEDNELVRVSCDENTNSDPNNPIIQHPTRVNESTGSAELVQVPYDESAHSDPNNPIVQHVTLVSEILEDGNNTEDMDNLMSGNLKGIDMENQKLSCYDKHLSESLMKKVYKVMVGATWCNKPCSKDSLIDKPSSLVPTVGSPVQRDSSARQNTSTNEGSPVTQSSAGAQDDCTTQGTPVTSVDPAPQRSPATEMQGSPAPQGNPVNTVNHLTNDNGDSGPSGEDGKDNITDADAHQPPCGQDHKDQVCGDSPLEPQSIQNSTTATNADESATKTAEIPVSQGECEIECNRPSGQDEIGESRISPQCNESDLACGQGEVPMPNTPATVSGTTVSACSGSNNNSPTNKQLTTATMDVPAKDNEGCGALSEDSITSLDSSKANAISAGSTVLPQPNGCASAADSCDTPDTPCTIPDPSVDAESKECHVSIPNECHDESTDSCEDGSSTGQNTVSVNDSMVSNNCCSNISCANTKSEDAPYDQKVTETIDTIDTHTEIKSEDSGYTAGPEEVVTVGVQSACQPDSDGQDTTSVSCDSRIVDSPAFTAMDLKSNNDGDSINPTGADIIPDNTTTECDAGVNNTADSPLSVPCEATKATWNSSDTSQRLLSYSFESLTLKLPLLLFMLINTLIRPASSQGAEVNLTISNVTEILSMVWNIENEPVSITSIITVVVGLLCLLCLCTCCWPVFLALVMHLKTACQRCQRACWYVLQLLFECIKHHSGQQVETLLSSTKRKRRAYCSNSVVKCAMAENCDPGEFVSVGYRVKEFRTDVGRGGVQQEETQPDDCRSEFAGLSYQRQERTVQVLPPQVFNFNILQANAETPPVQMVAMRLDPASQLLAFNAVIEEIEHAAPPDLSGDVPNHTPIILENSVLDSERGLLLSIGLADAEVPMFQLQGPPYAQPLPDQRGTANSVSEYPPLPGVPSTNAELQPVWPPLLVPPAASTPVVVLPIVYIP